MPDADNPTNDNWLKGIARGLEATGSLIVVGHSLGASSLLKYLSERRTSRVLTGLFLISTPDWGAPEGEMAQFALAPDFAKRLPDIPVYLYHCSKDPEIPIEHLHTYTRLLPHAKVRNLDCARHDFAAGLFPELIADIRALAESKGH
jgi:predicted alpha/beta hydrolase family esterase